MMKTPIKRKNPSIRMEEVLLRELKAIRKELVQLRERLPEPEDVALSAEERALLRKSYENQKKGLLLTSEQLRKKLIA